MRDQGRGGRACGAAADETVARQVVPPLTGGIQRMLAVRRPARYRDGSAGARDDTLRSQTRLVLTIAAAAAVLFGATALLASRYHEVRHGRAMTHLARGDALAARDERDAAIDQYRAALLLERDHPEAARALALTLLSLGRLSEAESYLGDLLRRFPTDGALNRGMARIHAARGRDAQARVAYQRALYGEWRDEAQSDRTETRFEFIDFLRKADLREEVIAELLRLKAEVPAAQTATLRRVASLFAEYGSTDLAIETLTAAASAAPADADLFAQMADLQVSAGRPTEARASLRTALSAAPQRPEFADRLRVVERVLALDPTLPNLRLVTRTRRARLILSAVVAQTARCGEADSAELQAHRREAGRRLRQRLRADAEAAEQDLSLALQLWSSSSDCHDQTVEAQALRQVLRRIEQTSEQPS